MGIDWTKEKAGQNLWDGKEIKVLKDLKDLIVSKGLKYEEIEKLSVEQKIINAVSVLVLEKSNNKQQLIGQKVDEEEKLIKQALERVFYVIPGYSDERTCAELAQSRLKYDHEQESAAEEGGYHHTSRDPELGRRLLGEAINGNNPFEIKKPAHRPGRPVSRSHFIRALRFNLKLKEVGETVAKDTERLDDAAIIRHCNRSKKCLVIPRHLEGLMHEVACELLIKLERKNILKKYLWRREKNAPGV